jgi:hypothetical protein
MTRRTLPLKVALIWTRPDVLAWCLLRGLRRWLEPVPHTVLVHWPTDSALPSWEYMSDVAIVSHQLPPPAALAVRAPHVDVPTGEVIAALQASAERGHFKQALLLGGDEYAPTLQRRRDADSKRKTGRQQSKYLKSNVVAVESGAALSFASMNDSILAVLKWLAEKNGATAEPPKDSSASHNVAEWLREEIGRFEMAHAGAQPPAQVWDCDTDGYLLPRARLRPQKHTVTLSDGNQRWCGWPTSTSRRPRVLLHDFGGGGRSGLGVWDGPHVEQLAPDIVWPCTVSWNSVKSGEARVDAAAAEAPPSVVWGRHVPPPVGPAAECAARQLLASRVNLSLSGAVSCWTGP